MGQLTHTQYDTLERALAQGSRVAIRRSGRREYIVIPLSLHVRDSREVIEARNPTTGHDLTIYLDEIDAIEALP